MMIIKTEWLDGRYTNNTLLDCSDKGCKRFIIKQVSKTFKGENQFIITESKLIRLLGIYGVYKTVYDEKCFERRIPLYFNSMTDACCYITQLEN